MSYTVHTRGGQVYSLDEADGFDLKVKWLEANKPFAIELDDDTMMSSQITKITKNKVTQADIPSFTRPTIAAGNKCQGQYSIQLEINQLAKAEGGKKWQQLIRDTLWREEMRQKLHATGAEWCDFREGKCACDNVYQPVGGRHNV